MRPPPETGDRWPNQAGTSYVADGPASYHVCEVKSLQWQRLQGLHASGRGGVMASPPPPRRRWLLERARAAFQQVLKASTVTYDQAEHRPIYLRAWTDSQAIGGGPRGRTR